MTDLSTLLSRVESGSGPDRELSFAVYKALGEKVADRGVKIGYEMFRGGLWRAMPELLTDLNAVIALVEARLPGWGWEVTTIATSAGGVRNPEALVVSFDYPPCVEITTWGTAPTPARALLAALLRAEMEKVT